VIAIEFFDRGKQEKASIIALGRRYGFNPFPGVNRDYLYLFRSQPRESGTSIYPRRTPTVSRTSGRDIV
jgi:hypothetical protein